MRHSGVAFAALLLWAGAAQAGPLDIAMGAPITQFRHEATATPGLYRIAPPVSPGRDFATTLVVATPTEGVCAIVMVSPPRTFDSAGAGVRAMFTHQTMLLAQEYGRPNRREGLRRDAVLKEPTDFAAALNTGQRELRADWRLAAPVEDVAAVRLEARAMDADATYLRLTYELANYSRCRASLRALQQARLLLGR